MTRAEEAIEISTMSDQTVVKKSIGRTVKAYVALTKPRVLELLLVSTVPVMFLAQGGLPDMLLVLATVIGGSLSAGSAAAWPACAPSRQRPLPRAPVSPHVEATGPCPSALRWP